MYLLDNCGEAILDRLLLERIFGLGCDLSIAARSDPVQDDITLEEAEELNFSDLGELLPSGESIRVGPTRAPRKLRKRLDMADLILSKGQGNFEILSGHEGSFRGRLAYLLVAKCGSVSKALEVPRESKVIRFVESG
ncbi:hypothetical protein AKJ47_02675 [candidate division MSBL1 archaeon SCGC-AAA261G05]|uniref:Damage-control phosphatase ARMT1-like metal-binding domain-containing protein n=2 Tax=candidate division MSBL1 TaxID=215777 RepID=A0A133V9U9_9EURY|nr:hypothetical protein AKJ47_02675 [candidate division MSBL1 archaeon SCGC-AAA261G05]KXB04088.1 hypothetical protein AKJ48_03405 [candidate division MSBL1 archaeon SCGC-AAA261O19]